MIPVALTIAGSDPSGGAGVQADLKTFARHGVYGAAAITLITVQNTRSVTQVEVLRPDLVTAQIRAVIEDLPVAVAKTGALGNRAVIEAVAAEARSFASPLVVDPVMISKHGAPLVADDARTAMRDLLMPLATLITPNLDEASALAGHEVRTVEEMKTAGRRLLDAGAKAVLVKGGHLQTSARDVLLAEGQTFEFESPHIDTPHTHGTGCTYASAIAAGMAKGLPLVDAVAAAKDYVTRAIRTAPGLGGGYGPVNHFA